MATGYCNIKGRGLKFCQGSISELQKKVQSFYKGITPETPPDQIEAISKAAGERLEAWGGYWLAHFGLQGNCIVKGEEPDFTFEDTVEWVEGLSEDDIRLIQATYQSTQEFINDIPKKAAKKKIVPKK